MMTIPGVPGLESDDLFSQTEETIPQLSEKERALLNAAASAAEQNAACPLCGHVCLEGELICPNCNTVLVSEGQTRRFGEEPQPANPRRQWPIGRVFVEEQQDIIFFIDGRSVVLPQQERVVIGRRSNSPSDEGPDVSLNSFKAEEQGVSRQHIRLRRAGDLVYISDLNSSNGTHLNGRLLTPQTNAILRSGDELRLGRLTVQVVFTPSRPGEQRLLGQTH